MKLESTAWVGDDTEVELFTPSLDFFKRVNPVFSLRALANVSSWASPEVIRCIQEIDGQFLIKILTSGGEKIVITDRWSSIPVFYTNGDRDFSSEPSSTGTVSELALFSIVLTRRLWGNMTTVEESRKIPAGSVACLSPAGLDIDVTRYYERNFEPVVRCKQEQASELAAALKSVVSELPDATLFLSGGLDTRSLLAAGSDTFSRAETIAFSESSRELKIASELCAIAGIPHEKSLFNIDGWSEILDEAVSHSKLGYPINSLFSLLPESSKLFVTGIGLDYMFQGMYLSPSRAEKEFACLESLLLNLPCGNRHLGCTGIINGQGIFEELVSIVEKQVARNRLNTRSENDALRLLMFDDASMHYSYTDYLSQSQRRRVVIPAFTVGLDALWTGYSADSVYDKNLMISALAELDVRLTRPRSANNDLPLFWGPQDRIALYARNAITRIFGRQQLEHERRTWPTQGWMVQRLIAEFGRSFFEGLSEELNFKWLSPDIVRFELDWFQRRESESRFASKHCDRENHILYLLGALLLARD